MKGKRNIGFPTDFMVLLVGSGGGRSYVWSADGTLQRRCDINDWLWDWKSRARSGWRSKCQDPQHIDGIKNLGVPKRQHQTDTQLQDAQGLSSGQRRNKSQASREERDVLDEAVAWKPGIGSVTWVDVAGRSSVPQGMEQFPLSWNKPHWREIP